MAVLKYQAKRGQEEPGGKSEARLEGDAIGEPTATLDRLERPLVFPDSLREQLRAL